MTHGAMIFHVFRRFVWGACAVKHMILLSSVFVTVATPAIEARADTAPLLPFEEPERPSLVPKLQAVATGSSPVCLDPDSRWPCGEPEGTSPPERCRAAEGSGVIFAFRRGHVMTDGHVVANADRMTVGLPQGRKTEATPMGTDTDGIPGRSATGSVMADARSDFGLSRKPGLTALMAFVTGIADTARPLAPVIQMPFRAFPNGEFDRARNLLLTEETG